MALINAPHLLNLKEFAQYVGISHSHLGEVCRSRERRVRDYSITNKYAYIDVPKLSGTEPRYYDGLKLPFPIEGDFSSTRRIWDVKDAKEFKLKRLKLENFIKKLNGD